MPASPYTDGGIFYSKIMIKITYIYVSITVSLIKFIYLRWGIKKIQHLMLDNPE